jgi:beta-lactamase regulating signal transducer with metallopeptidase domain
MSWAWTTAAGWLLPGVLAGGLLLLVARVLSRYAAGPARRQRLGEWAVAAALLAVGLSFGPRWLRIPVAPAQPPEPAQAVDRPAEDGPPAAEPAGPALPPAPEAAAGGEPWDGFMPAPEEEMPVAPADPPPAAAAPEPPAVVAPAPSSPEAPPAATTWLDVAPLVLGWLGVAHAAGALVLLGRWLVGQVGLWRLLRGTEPVAPDVARVCAALRGGRPLPRLLQSPRLRVPLSCGLLRPTVVLPSSLCGQPGSAALRWVLAHELTHLERRDVWSCLLFALGEVVFYALPWFWWLRRQARLCREYLADAAAAAQAGAAEDYAQFLLSLTAAPAAPAGAMGVTGHTSDLFRRVAMLLRSPGLVEKRPPRLWSVGVAAGLLSLAALVAGVGLRAEAVRADEPAKKDLTRKEDPKKDAEKKEQPKKDDKKEEPKKDGDVEVFPDIDAWLKNLPAGMDPEQVKAIREQMMRLREQMKRQFPNGLPGQGMPRFGGGLGGGAGFGGLGGGAGGQNNFFQANPFGGFAGGGGFAGHPHEGRLGVMVKEPGATLVDQLDLPKGQGVVIESVEPDSAAAKAGLKPNDILLELNGKAVSNDVAEVVKMIHGIKAKTPVDAVVLRKGKKETVKGISLPEVKTVEQPGFQFQGGGLGFAAPPALPAPPGGFAGGGGIGGAGFFGAGNGVMTSVFRSGDRFTARHQEGNLVITVTGTVADGKATTKTINVQDGGQTEKYESVDKVPEQYRDKVKSLVEMGEKGAAKVELKSEK